VRPALDLRLYAVLDPARCRGRLLPELAAAAARGGATLLQYRDKRNETRHLVSNARAILEALSAFDVPLLINDRIDVALAAGATGAHVGREDMAPEDARRLLGADAILGVTIHHAAEALPFAPGLADYAGCGPVYATQSKDPGDPPLGPEGLGRLLRQLSELQPGLPACGIAGIDHRNAPEVIAAGAAGVAVISDIFMAEDVETATRRLRTAVDTALASKESP
jgi:thiamine-phosphate pyrophosphorylase